MLVSGLDMWASTARPTTGALSNGLCGCAVVGHATNRSCRTRSGHPFDMQCVDPSRELKFSYLSFDFELGEFFFIDLCHTLETENLDLLRGTRANSSPVAASLGSSRNPMGFG